MSLIPNTIVKCRGLIKFQSSLTEKNSIIQLQGILIEFEILFNLAISLKK